MPNQNLCLTLDANKGMHPRGPLFCRPGALPGASDIKEYDAGNIFYSSEGTTNGSQVGFIQIKGRVKLFKRLLDGSNSLAPINNSVSSFYQVDVVGGVTTAEAIIPVATVEGTNGLAVVNTAGVLLLPAGNYLIDWNLSLGTSTAIGVASLITARLTKNGATVKYILEDGSGDCLLNCCYYVSSNGTDVFSLRATATFAAGAVNYDASVRVVAI